MANGPPTPPPTTDAEIRDEARMSDAPAPAPAAVEENNASTPATITETAQPQPPQQPIPLQDPYQLIFPRIAELASQNRWVELIDTAEITEINASNEQQLSRLFVVVPLILAYLIQNEIAIAKLVLERLQSNIISTPLIKAVGSLTVAYSAGAYEKIYSKAETLLNAVAQPAFPEPELAQVIKGMVESFILSLRDRTFVLLSRAYTSISLSHAEMYFGMKADDLLPVAARHGWAYDVSSKVLRPVPAKEPASLVTPAISSLTNFSLIAQSVSQLEM
ncbi:hypothetical protein GYMLUDRAFT_699536 [Collybiopsis luxurians FD-317 M1]|uniref:Unplaced genomic scaffold GYMLUscaffold_38, whole genome shotgun sequence n=1 Tax=Collybiopsis luxurians FD-317 M1 TaxID=944289 RepID=A0A0D0C6Q1_9AGAR|nr:hypothetical protein GYMLUDRAFT_699536 [Collybiopsis luxurians FD-317 M1]